jgi:hypothetical protein
MRRRLTRSELKKSRSGRSLDEILNSLDAEGLRQLERNLLAIARRSCLRVLAGGKKGPLPNAPR